MRVIGVLHQSELALCDADLDREIVVHIEVTSPVDNDSRTGAGLEVLDIDFGGIVKNDRTIAERVRANRSHRNCRDEWANDGSSC